MRISFVPTVLVTAVLAALLLGACAHPDWLRPGMSRSELDTRFGKPVSTRHEGDEDILVYTAQPLGQRASAAHVGPDGRVASVEPLLNTEHFARIRVGEWKKDDVREYFGPPAEVTATRLYPEVWSYRYREAEEWDSLFSIMFDKSGTVRQTQNGPDPMYSPEDHGRN